MEVFRPPFFPGRVAHLTESCNAPPCSAGQRHPPGTELSDQRTITVFATKISIYLHLAHCAVLHKATTSYVYFTSVFDRDSCIFLVFSFGWVQMVENTILQESRKIRFSFPFFFFFFLNLCQLSSSFLPLPDLSSRPQHSGAQSQGLSTYYCCCLQEGFLRTELALCIALCPCILSTLGQSLASCCVL